MFFSIVVPVYNVEKYLRECIDSILRQTFTDFEQVNAPVVSSLPQDAKHNFGWMGTNMPSLRLQYERFCSDSIIDFYNLVFIYITYLKEDLAKLL